jgi:pentapeptide MXKDX repeat protein
LLQRTAALKPADVRKRNNMSFTGKIVSKRAHDACTQAKKPIGPKFFWIVPVTNRFARRRAGRRHQSLAKPALEGMTIMTIRTRIALVASAAALSLGVALAPAAFADETMKKDTMSKDSMAKDSMKKDTMSKDSMKKDDTMSKDTVKKDDAMKKN